jgi:hypothetical protein
MRFLVPKLLLGAALCAGLATLTANPAAAVDTEIGAVHVSNAEYTDVLWTRFGGPVSQFTVIPTSDAVNCRNITINYKNGDSSTIFRGFIAKGQHTTVALPAPNPGDVRSVTFACKSEGANGARIALAAVTDNWPAGWDTVDERKPATLVQEPVR